MLRVYIIIVNYKNWQDTIDCLNSVFESSYRNFSVIVTDNDSGNDSVEQLIKWATGRKVHQTASGSAFDFIVLEKDDLRLDEKFVAPDLTIVQNSTNAGFAGGNNVGLRLIRDENAFFWLLNPDIIIKENTLEELVKFTSQKPLNAIIGGQVLSLAGNHELLFYGGAKINLMTSTIKPLRTASPDPRLDYIHGACLFSHTSNLRTVGLLPEKYFLYWEESDWCYRARKLGSELFVCPTAICYDKVSTSIGRGFKADYYYTRNGLLFVSKFKRKNIPAVLFFNTFRFLKRIMTGKWSNAKGVLKGTMDFFKMKKDEAE